MCDGWSDYCCEVGGADAATCYCPREPLAWPRQLYHERSRAASRPETAEVGDCRSGGWPWLLPSGALAGLGTLVHGGAWSCDSGSFCRRFPPVRASANPLETGRQDAAGCRVVSITAMGVAGPIPEETTTKPDTKAVVCLRHSMACWSVVCLFGGWIQNGKWETKKGQRRLTRPECNPGRCKVEPLQTWWGRVTVRGRGGQVHLGQAPDSFFRRGILPTTAPQHPGPAPYLAYASGVVAAIPQHCSQGVAS